MKLFALVVLVSAFAIGCKGPEKDFEALADRACACADNDTACGAKVLADVSKFTAANSTNGSQKWIETGVRLNDCLTSTGVQPTEVTTVLAQLGH
jgi:hypothetical protein